MRTKWLAFVICTFTIELSNKCVSNLTFSTSRSTINIICRIRFTLDSANLLTSSTQTTKQHWLRGLTYTRPPLWVYPKQQPILMMKVILMGRFSTATGTHFLTHARWLKSWEWWIRNLWKEQRSRIASTESAMESRSSKWICSFKCKGKRLSNRSKLRWRKLKIILWANRWELISHRRSKVVKNLPKNRKLHRKFYVKSE